MIRVDALWLSTRPLDMRAGTETILAQIVRIFGEAQPYHAYLFANRRGTRLKVLIHDGYGIWLANRRLNQGRFQLRPSEGSVALTRGQFEALILGLPWERLADGGGGDPGSVTVHHWGSPRWSVHLAGGIMSAMTLPANLDQLTADELRELVRQQAEDITHKDRELNWRKVKIDKLTHEVAYYKRHYFGIKAERLPVEQGQLFEETLAADMAAITEELAQLSESKPKGQAKRKPLPPELPRTEIHHEPESTTCACGCQMQRIGEDVAEKLDYTPGTFTVERHIRGKWACAQCETLVQAPVPAHVIDKGIPTTGLLAHVLIAKYLDHLPLYRRRASR